MAASVAEKPLTPAQTAKPYGTAAKEAEKARRQAPKKEDAKSSDGSVNGSENGSTAARDEALKAVEKLQIKTKAVNANNIARVANSYLTSSDEKLHPLISLKTAKSIEKFPATSKDIAKLGLVTVDAILNALDADRSGNEDVKKQRLREQLGLKPNPA